MRAILSGFTGFRDREVVITRQLRFISRHRRYRPFPSSLSLFADVEVGVQLGRLRQPTRVAS